MRFFTVLATLCAAASAVPTEAVCIYTSSLLHHYKSHEEINLLY